MKVPGIVFTDENIGMDQMEVSNFNWNEYLYWLKRNFGAESEAYRAALPDTSVWLQMDSSYHDLSQNYLRHPMYRNYPVIGVSYEQAVNFSRWRSDRVMEYFLIKKKKYTWEHVLKNTGDSTFTIEKYKNHEVPGVIYDPSITSFPNYHLPNQQEINLAMRYLDKIRTEKLNQRLIKISNNSATNNRFPLPVNMLWAKSKSPWICSLSNNVSEWVSGGSEVFGQNWLSYSTDPTNAYAFETSKPHQAIGFRCAFNWSE